jgi:hypothetical protein
VASNGRILQPDKPATAVDSTFAFAAAADTTTHASHATHAPHASHATHATHAAHAHAARTAPPGMVWATYTALDEHVWHYILSINVTSQWKLHAHDLYPALLPPTDPAPPPTNPAPPPPTDPAPLPPTNPAPLPTNPAPLPTVHDVGASGGWVAHSWFTGHAPTPCVHGAAALASGCVCAHGVVASELPPLHNTRPLMVANDSATFDLLQLSPVVHGWVLLGEADAYVVPCRTSRAPALPSTATSVRKAHPLQPQVQVVANVLGCPTHAPPHNMT